MSPLFKEDEFEFDLPYCLPTCDEFSTSLCFIKSPLVAFERAVLSMEMECGLKADEGMVAVANIIHVFLEQLEYLIEHSEIEGTPISHAEVNHPFQIRPKIKKESKEGLKEVQNA